MQLPLHPTCQLPAVPWPLRSGHVRHETSRIRHASISRSPHGIWDGTFKCVSSPDDQFESFDKKIRKWKSESWCYFWPLSFVFGSVLLMLSTMLKESHVDSTASGQEMEVLFLSRGLQKWSCKGAFFFYAQDTFDSQRLNITTESNSLQAVNRLNLYFIVYLSNYINK